MERELCGEKPMERKRAREMMQILGLSEVLDHLLRQT